MVFDLEDIAPTYEFYTDTYHGHMNKETFVSSLSDALAEVEYYIWPLADIEPHVSRIQKAVCAVAEIIGNPEKLLTSYTAGEVREEFDKGAGYSLSAEAAVRRYLANTGILKRGRWL